MSDRIVRYKFKIEAHEDNSKALTAIAKETAKAVKAIEADKEKTRKAHWPVAEKGEEGLTKAAKRELVKRGKELKRQLDKDMRERERNAKQQVALAKRSAGQLAREYSAAHGKIAVGRAQMVEGFTAGTGEVAKFARGFAALGVAGEENTQQLLSSLVKIQGTFDVVTGGLNAYVKLKKAVEGYLLAARGAATVETAARTASIAQIRVEIAEENALAISRQRSAVAAAGSSAARIGGGAVGAAGTAASGAAGAVGTGAVGAAGGAAVGAAGMAALFTAAAASVGVAGKIIHESITGSAKDIDSWSMKIGEWEASMLNWARIWDDGTRSLEGFIQRSEQRQAAQMRATAHESIGMTAYADRRSARLDAAMNRESTGPLDKLGNLSQAGLLASTTRSTLENQPTVGVEAEATRKAALLEVMGIEARIAKERLSTQQSIIAERRKEFQEAIAAAKTELSLAKDKIKATRDSLMSAKERFGNLSEQEQNTLKKIQAKAESEGVNSLTAAERQKLAGVGTSQARGIAREGAIAAADAAGFDESFGSQERADIAKNEAKRDKLEIAVEAANKVEVEISRNEDELVRQVADEVNRILDERTQIIIDRVTEEASQQTIDVNRTSNEEYVGRTKQATGGR